VGLPLLLAALGLIAAGAAWLETGPTASKEIVLVATLAAVAAAPASSVAAQSAPVIPPAAAPAPWKTVWLDHISYAVADYRKSTAFYRDLMGWEIRNDNGTSQCTLKIGNVGEIIIRNRRPPAAEAAPTAGSGAQPAPTARVPLTGVINHVSWGIEPWSTEGVKAELERRGLKPRPDMVGENFKSYHVTDPDGWDLQISNKTGPARGDRALRIADCGLRIGSRIDPESAIRNPQSAIQGGSEMPAVPHRLAPDEPENDGREGRMGFLEHLDELRTRIIRSCIAIGVGMLAAFAFVDRLADIVLTPIVGTLPPGSSLVFIRPGEAFSFYLNVAFIGGMLLAAPFVMYQVWGFIAPGLYANEKKFLIPFVVLTSAGSLSGALFSQYLLFPGLMKFYGAFNSPRMRFMPGVEETVELYMKMMIGMIVVFQIPTVVFFLAKMRLLTARFLWRHFKYAILYLLSIGLAWIVAPKRGQETSNGSDSTRLRLAFAATVIDQAARRHRTRSFTDGVRRTSIDITNSSRLP